MSFGSDIASGVAWRLVLLGLSLITFGVLLGVLIGVNV